MRVTKSSHRSKNDHRHKLPLQVGPDVLLLVILLILATSLGFAMHALGWHRALIGFGRRLATQPRVTLASWYQQNTVPTLSIDQSFADYETLVQARDQARRLGAYVPEIRDRAAATIRYQDDEVTVELQPLAGLAEALPKDVWPLSVHAEDVPLSGMQQSMLIPVEHDYLATWGYLETLRRADILTVRSQLVRLSINGDDKGLYVLEELPTSAMVTPEQLVVGFDAGAYWATVVHLGETVPESGFQYADMVVLGAEDDLATRDEARRRLYNVQSGELAPAHAFDVMKLGRFMAITTLWRGTPAVDWRTVRWAYSPEDRRFTPIGQGYHPHPLKPLPEIFTDDPVIQIAYARALREFSQPTYLAELERALASDLEDLRLRLGTALAENAQPWSMLETHQRLMRAQLSPSEPVSAYFVEGEESLWFGLANLQQLPVEITGLNMGEDVFLSADPAWVLPDDRELILEDEAGLTLTGLDGPVPRFLKLRVPTATLNGHGGGPVQVIVRIVGLPSEEIEVEALYDAARLHFPNLETHP